MLDYNRRLFHVNPACGGNLNRYIPYTVEITERKVCTEFRLNIKMIKNSFISSIFNGFILLKI